MRSSRNAGALSLLLVGGCTAWGGTLTVEGIPATPPPAKVFQVWQDGVARELHRVRVSSDTVRGVPTSQPAACDSCVVAIAKVDVDSVRVREFRPAATTWTVIGLTWVLIRTGALTPVLEWILSE